jgi:hypothetical protein
MQQQIVIAVLVAALISALLAVVLHYFPWRTLTGRCLPRLWAYALGVVSFASPLSVLLALWGDWLAAIALWSVIASAGLAVISVTVLDALAGSRLDARQALEREQQLRKMVTTHESAETSC